jgi:hypothetical protein
MKTRNLLIALSVTAMATLNVFASEALLSPRATDHQSKIMSGVNADPNLAAPGLVSVSPRVIDSQMKSPSAVCVRRMAGTPKMIGQCADHPGAPMSCCSVAPAK